MTIFDDSEDSNGFPDSGGTTSSPSSVCDACTLGDKSQGGSRQTRLTNHISDSEILAEILTRRSQCAL